MEYNVSSEIIKMQCSDKDESYQETKIGRENEKNWNLQRVTSLLLVWLGGGIAGCGGG